MRILMLTQFYPPVIGGEERHVRNLSAALVRKGHEVTVATQANHDAPSSEVDQGVDVRRLRGTLQRSTGLFSDAERRHMPPFPDPEFALALRSLVAKTQPQVVHAHNWIVHTFAPLKRIARAPLLLTLHDFGWVCAKKTLMRGEFLCEGPQLAKCFGCASEHYGALKGVVTAGAIRLMGAMSPVDKVLAVSQAVADGNRLKHREIPFEVVPNFIADDAGHAPDLQDPRLDALPKGDFLLFVGDLTAKKGIHVLIEAHRQLKNAPPLVLIGRPCPDTPTAVPEGVRILTNWSHAAVLQAFKRCQFALAPSIWPEPCATVVLEAMAYGRAVVSTRVGGMPDMIVHDQTGLLVAPNDPSELSMAMALLIDAPDLRHRMGVAGRERVVAFQAQTIVPKIEDVYRSLIEGYAP